MNMHLSDAHPIDTLVMSLPSVDYHKLKIPIGGKRLEKIQGFNELCLTTR